MRSLLKNYQNSWKKAKTKIEEIFKFDTQQRTHQDDLAQEWKKAITATPPCQNPKRGQTCEENYKT